MRVSSKSLASILLVAAVLNIGRLVAVFFQTKYVLLSPIIPKGVIAEVAAPHIFHALISSLMVAAALIFYFYSKYIVSIIICACTIITPVSYYYIFFSN
jgi:hypothetical protein